MMWLLLMLLISKEPVMVIPVVKPVYSRRRRRRHNMRVVRRRQLVKAAAVDPNHRRRTHVNQQRRGAVRLAQFEQVPGRRATRACRRLWRGGVGAGYVGVEATLPVAVLLQHRLQTAAQDVDVPEKCIC